MSELLVKALIIIVASGGGILSLAYWFRGKALDKATRDLEDALSAKRMAEIHARSAVDENEFQKARREYDDAVKLRDRGSSGENEGNDGQVVS